MMNKGNLYVISAPSGCGKDTIITRVLDKLGDKAMLSVSMTTREIRIDEKEGKDYYFVTPEVFHKNISDGLMLEYAQYGSNFYGTPVGPVKESLEKGVSVILNIEVKGGRNVKNIFPDAVKIFIIPPSMEVLEQRLRKRGTDSEDAILTRLRIAKDELEKADEYEFIVENDVLDEAVEDILTIIRATELKYKNMKNKVREVIKNA